MYEYTAKIVDVYDGDTFTFYVDLGFDVWVKSKLRLHGIDTPEVRGSERVEGLKARDYVRNLILDKPVTIKVHKKGKYGRYIAEVFFKQNSMPELISLSDHLVEHGFAKRVSYA